jgi:hypothetical protein
MTSSFRMAALLTGCLLAVCSWAQETRSSISGRVVDPQGAAVAGARVRVTNTNTGVAIPLTTNETGYYEANLLLPGTYEVTAESAGFQKSIRKGVVLLMGSRADVEMRLEVGAVAESVTVVSTAPLLDTTSASSGRVVDNRTQAALPVSFNNVTLFARLVPGIQSNGEVRILGPADQGSSSDYHSGTGVGGNEWALDGAANTQGRSVGALPHADTVAEMKVETSGFDAAIGHTTGVVVSLMTKSGTNQYHGSVSDSHLEDRWNAMNFFSRQLYYRNIASLDAAGKHDEAEALRNGPKQPSGHKDHYAMTIGGPVSIPKVFNGKDKLFFFFGFVGLDSYSTTSSQYLNNTFPTLQQRTGDFSDILQVGSQYQIYDPLTVRSDPARAGHYVRDPLPGNILPASRINNPAYSTYEKYLPTPNNNPVSNRTEPYNNFLGSSLPFNFGYVDYTTRIDYNHSPKHRFYGRLLWNDMNQNLFDWAYSTQPGVMGQNNPRHNAGGVLDWVFLPQPSTMFDFSIAVHEYRSGSGLPVTEKVRSYKPSDVGLPTYMDTFAGAQHVLPQMNVGGYTVNGGTAGFGPTGITTYTHFRTLPIKLDASYIRGRHSLRAGFETRQYFRAGGGGGNTSGNFSFSNTYVQRTDDGFTPAGTIGLSWASFMMGLPSGMSVAYTDSYATNTPFYGGYVQDNWRVTPKLNVNLGLRFEYELGPTERYNRTLANFDTSLQLPIASAAQAAYAKNPIAELAASGFVVRGGSVYANADQRRIRQNQLMWEPRIAVAYQAGPRMAVRAGYGVFYDTLNVLTESPNQLGFSQSTSTVLTTDYGVNWLVGNPRAGVSPMTDPFPVRSDGTRFDLPLREALGAMAVVGRSYSFNAWDTERARVQRWRLSFQNQLSPSTLIDVAYAGSYAGNVYLTKNLNALPAQYWATGTTRNDAVANSMNANVANPFQLANFASLKTSDPVLYQSMSTLSFFTSSTIRRNQLLRPYPQMSGLSQTNSSYGAARTHELDVTFERRFARGLNAFVTYTRMYARAADWFANEFDVSPTWEESNLTKPHRITASGLWELPFGKNRRFAQQGLGARVLGGWQLSLSYEFQPGSLIAFPNLFYYGDLSDIALSSNSFSKWFNTANFERTPSKAPAAYQARVFPQYVSGVRADFTNISNASVQREFKLWERASLLFRVDAMNLQNRTQMAAPDVTPTSTTFGQTLQQSWTQKRYYEFQARLRF